VRVLVVDDTQLVRERLVAMIAAIAGIESVAQASDGVAGLAAIAAHTTDVVVLDIRMPRLNGLQMLAALRYDSSAPVRIVVSNHVEYMEHALLGGASFFFDKSTQLDAMLATLGRLAAGARPPS
jgi:two-component system response regulator DevR